MISKDQLKSIMPNITSENLEAYYQPLNEVMEKYGITTPIRQAMFLAQVAHESNELKNTVENLNYSALRLAQVFPRYFRSIDEAREYHFQPEKIANRVYANRMGNGPTESGDGWTFRGRGCLQVTGRNNYVQVSKDIGIDFVQKPELLEGPIYSLMAACSFWNRNDLNKLSDTGDIKLVTKKVNGGLNGLIHREEIFKRATKVL